MPTGHDGLDADQSNFGQIMDSLRLVIQGEDQMTIDQQLPQLSTWAKQRLDEIEATLKAVHTRVGTLGAEAKLQAEKAIAEMTAQQEVFKKAIKTHQAEGEAAWTNAKSALEANWAAFETTVRKYVTEARQTAEQQQALFAVRAEAQRKAWEQSAEAFAQQVSGFSATKRQEFDTALAQAKAGAETAKSRLDAAAKAGTQSWDAMKKALEDSRAAFDKAAKEAQDAFKRAS
jgi:hypothetical protein